MTATSNIIRYDIIQKVKVRKYSVDIKGLQNLLRNQKKITDLTNKEIAKALDIPLTNVEHWFRLDQCFSIPDASIWHQLKEVLCITTDVFDASIMTFIEKDNSYEIQNRLYDSKGICPTLTSTMADKLLILEDKND